MTEKAMKKRYWDKAVVAIGAIVGFSIIVMKITGYWPCDIINLLSGSYYC